MATSMGSTLVLDSRKLLLENIMRAVSDDETYMIGIWGLGGIGKTTTMKEVQKWAMCERMFNDIVIVEVSQMVDLRKLQQHIGVWLRLSLDDHSVSSGATMIYERLTEEVPNAQARTFLIILDDIWKELDLSELGIPSQHRKGCKIMFTSRSRAVCAKMLADQIFEVEPLPEKEGMQLFLQELGTSPEYQQLAKQIVGQCNGLPLKIRIVAQKLVGRSDVYYWRYVLEDLIMFPGEFAEIVMAQKVSYDYLESDKTKHIFRVCSLFPKDSEIETEDVVRHWIPLRFTTETYNLEQARNEAHSHIRLLEESNLLVESKNPECINMEEVIRQMALSIESEHNTVVSTEKLHPWLLYEISASECTSISLMCEEMVLPEGLVCPNLKLLRLTGSSNCTVKFPDKFFEHMKEVQVLSLNSMSISSLPGSLQLLVNLQTLSIKSCKLLSGDVSLIGNIEALEILSFASSNIEEIPTEIGNLKKLKLMDLTGCSNLRRIAPGVFANLSCLEDLYMKGTSVCWAEQMQQNDKGEANASFYEVKSLSTLVNIEIYVPYEVLPIAGKKPTLFCKGRTYNRTRLVNENHLARFLRFMFFFMFLVFLM